MNDLNRCIRLRRRVSVVQSSAGALHGGTLLWALWAKPVWPGV